jgi:hypothetical protein
LSELISNYIVRNYVSVEGGKAQIQFVLSEDGKLLGEPNVLTSENDQLKILLTRAVNELSPFPPFPQGIKRNQEKFLILINIPDTEETVFESDSNQFENVFFNGYGMSYENEKDGLETESELLSESENLLSNYSNYRKTINRKILNAAKGFDGKNGVVKIQFTINRLGELVKEPVIISNTGSKELEDLTVKTLKSVCPFDPMPESVLENNVNFIVSIVYE